MQSTTALIAPTAVASRHRGAERVRVFCRLRPLLQREKEGWSYEEFTQQFGEDNDNGSDSNTNNNANDRDQEEGKEQTPETTFVTEKGRLNFSSSASSAVTLAGDGKTIHYHPQTQNSNSDKREFTFDASLSESADQSQVYQQVAQEIVQDVLQGYNGTIFAYGQTSTGKTHTMVGREGQDLLHGDQRGIIPRALEEIFQCADKTRAQTKTSIALSYVQIYCERVFDLLSPETPHSSILIREDPDRGVYLDGASCMRVASVADCLRLLESGKANRAVASTGMNAHSSRSHAVLILRIERKDFPTTTAEALSSGSSTSSPLTQMIKISNLYLVDLAGSERVKKAKVMGRHVSELKAINLSLSALGNCISALSKKQKHVPYRDSKLTRLLQSSLGGNAKTALVITITPSPTEAHETLSTMQFGQRAMQVTVNAHCNVLSVLDYKSLYEDVQQRVDALDERARALEYEALEHKSKVAQYEDQLLKAHMRIQHLEFENQAGKAALEANAHQQCGDISDGSGLREVLLNNGTNMVESPILTQQLAELVTKHDQDVNKIKEKCDLQVYTYMKLADQASQEWHEVEDALASEKLQVLNALQELKEFKVRYFELEEETTDRIAELVQEVKEKEREVRDVVDGTNAQLETQRKEIKALKKQLATTEKERDRLQEEMEADFVPKETIAQMEALYEKAIAKLQERVGCLETKSTSSNGGGGGSQRRIMVAPPSSNQFPERERANIGGPQGATRLVKGSSSAGAAKAIPKIGRIVPGSKASSLPNGLR